jgi:hypothetical protein
VKRFAQDDGFVGGLEIQLTKERSVVRRERLLEEKALLRRGQSLIGVPPQ